MDPTDAISQIAVYARQVPGLSGASYPAKTSASTWPQLFLFWGETTITQGSEQLWMMTVEGDLVYPVNNDFPITVGRVDPLITPLVDLFAERPARNLLDTAGDGVDYAAVTRIVPNVNVGINGLTFYGAQLFWTVKNRRQAA